MIAAQLARQHPDTNTGWRLRLVSLSDQLTGDAKPTLLLLSIAVALILLIACVNVANLQLSRGAVRARELAVRAALGAGRGRLTRQLVTESVLLSAIGGAGGVALSYGSLSAVAALAPAELTMVTAAPIDASVLAFTALVAVVTGLIFGILPATRACRANASNLLRPSGGTAAGGRSALGRLLVGAELAVATGLVIAAGLLLRTVSSISRVDPGFNPADLTTFALSVPTALDEVAVRSFFGAFVERVATLPGIEHVALASEVPLSDQHSDAFFRVEGVRLADSHDRPTANIRRVTADYFRALGVRMIHGREFSTRDAVADAPVVAINEAFASRYVPGDPLGRRLLIERFPNERAYEIVAVVGNIRHDALDEPAAPEMYIPSLTFWTPNVLVRSPLPPSVLLAAIRPELKQLDPTVPISAAVAYHDRLRQSFDAHRFRTLLLAAFSVISMVLSAVGVYGLAAYSVSQRTREIGVRLALGASPNTVLAAELAAAGRLAALGIAGGIVVGLVLSHTMRGLLFNVSAGDPLTIAITATLLSGITLIASFIAARRVTRSDPTMALRAD